MRKKIDLPKDQEKSATQLFIVPQRQQVQQEQGWLRFHCRIIH